MVEVHQQGGGGTGGGGEGGWSERRLYYFTYEVNKRLFIVKQLAHINAQTSTITVGHTTFLESVLQYHLCIIYGHFTSDMKRQYNHVINTAHKLCKGKLETSTLDEIFSKHFKAPFTLCDKAVQ